MPIESNGIVLSWEQKLAACAALAEVSLKMRKPGDWYVCQSVNIKRKHTLSGNYGNGTSPEDAIADHWKVLTELLKPDECIVIGIGAGRKGYRWNGFMWREVEEEKAA